MENFLPEKLVVLAKRISPLYVVGGMCRDCLAGFSRSFSDWDICAPADAQVVCAAARQCGFEVKSVYPRTGTVKLCADGINYEFTCFRSDEYAGGLHTPVRVTFTKDIVRDALRRDFKCNAVYYDIAARAFVDPLGGMADIAAGRMTTVAPPDKVFGEDGLRLMRLCRIAAQTGFSPDGDCMEGARRNAALISDIAAERIWAELDLVLHADEKYGVPHAQYRGLKLLKETGVLALILPELAEGDGLEQRSDFHDHDVLEHSLRCVKYADGGIRLAALLHDVGKPVCMKSAGRAAGHETVGAEIAEKICARLKVSKALTEETVRLVSLHMYDYNGAASEGKVRKFIVRNLSVLDKLLDLKQADYSACKDDTGKAPVAVKWESVLARMREEGAPFSVKELRIRGDELIAAGICPEQTGKTLFRLLEECAVDPAKNRRETLVKLALGYQRAKGDGGDASRR